MKRILLIVLASLAGTLAVYAQAIRDLDIRVVLQKDGSARITQVWDVNVNKGTEWYVPISNLGKMSITDFSVSENGLAFYNEGRRWDVDRSLSEKAGRCGIVEKRDGVELCWGQGSLGDHVWTAEFTAHGLVQSFSDADGFNTIWRYFGWANQTLACFTLWTVTAWLTINKKGLYYLIGMLPAAFMTAVCTTYICVDKIGFHLPPAWIPYIAVGVFALSVCLYYLLSRKLRKEK